MNIMRAYSERPILTFVSLIISRECANLEMSPLAVAQLNLFAGRHVSCQ